MKSATRAKGREPGRGLERSARARVAFPLSSFARMIYEMSPGRTVRNGGNSVFPTDTGSPRIRERRSPGRKQFHGRNAINARAPM